MCLCNHYAIFLLIFFFLLLIKTEGLATKFYLSMLKNSLLFDADSHRIKTYKKLNRLFKKISHSMYT